MVETGELIRVGRAPAPERSSIFTRRFFGLVLLVLLVMVVMLVVALVVVVVVVDLLT